jgi:hypothetical protein
MKLPPDSEPDAPPPLGNFDVYNIPDALWPSSFQDASVFLNDNRTRRALHAPINKDWTPSFEFVFGESVLITYSIVSSLLITLYRWGLRYQRRVSMFRTAL